MTIPSKKHLFSKVLYGIKYCAVQYWTGKGKFYLARNSVQMLYLITFTEAAIVCDSTVILETIPIVIFEIFVTGATTQYTHMYLHTY